MGLMAGFCVAGVYVDSQLYIGVLSYVISAVFKLSNALALCVYLAWACRYFFNAQWYSLWTQ